MNGQFRYYLAGVSFVPSPGDGCPGPLLALRLAVENLHGNPTAAIRGRFTFAQSVGGERSTLTETIGIPYPADIVGPFSDRRGGVVYVTAYADRTDAFLDPKRWAQIAEIGPSRLKIFFRPDAFYYPDGTQYVSGVGRGPAAREPMTCGGGAGAARAIDR